MVLVTDPASGGGGPLSRSLDRLREQMAYLEEQRRKREEEERRRLAREAAEIRQAAARRMRENQERERAQSQHFFLRERDGSGLGGQIRRMGDAAESIGGGLGRIGQGSAGQLKEMATTLKAEDIAPLAEMAARIGTGPQGIGQTAADIITDKRKRDAAGRAYEASTIPLVREEDLPGPDWFRRGFSQFTTPQSLGLTAMTGGLGKGLPFVAKAFGADLLGSIGYEATRTQVEDQPWYIREPASFGGAIAAGSVPFAAPRLAGALRRASRKGVESLDDETVRRLVNTIQDERGEFDFGAIDEIRARLRPEARPSGGVFDDVKPNEPVARGVAARYEGEISTGRSQAALELEEGNTILQRLGLGQRDGRAVFVERTPEVEQLYAALHGEAPVPPRLQPLYDWLKLRVDEETARTVDASPHFVPRDEYFNRMWRQLDKPHSRTRPGTPPGFMRPRQDATFKELLDSGMEPPTWNPVEMLVIRHEAGTRFRATQNVVDRLKESGTAIEIKPGESLPRGYRVPEVGPAFEGKTFSYMADEGGNQVARTGVTSRWALPESEADRVESIFGKDADFGRVGNWLVTAGEKTKRGKLLLSLFQQADFARRSGWSGMAGAIHALRIGHPVRATQELVNIPVNIGQMVRANVSPARRRALQELMLSDTPIVPERPGVTLKGIRLAGWRTSDTSVIDDVLKARIDDIAGGAKPGGLVRRRIRTLNQAIQNGLFQGVYPQVQISMIKGHFAPHIIRQHPDWTDAQIMRAIADEVNIRTSSLGNYQSVFQSPFARKALRGVIFSSNEAEAIIKQALKPFMGTQKALSAEYGLAVFLSLAITAEAVHYAATGEHLPVDRFQPVKGDSGSPLKFSYNRDFLAPDIPIEGRGGTALTLDMMAQMDTAMRVLDPESFLESRFSVPVRAAVTQATGEDFYGRPVRSPMDRATNLVMDLWEPIAVAQVRSAFDVGPDSEARVGTLGSLIQAAGENVRAETNAQIRDRIAREAYGKPWGQLSPRQKNEVLEGNPGLREELERRKDEAAATGADWAIKGQQTEEWQEDALEGQLEDDAAFEKGDLSGADYREREAKRRLILRERINALRATDEQGAPGTDPVSRLGAALDAATSADGVTVDHEAVDRFYASLTAEELAYIERNTGLKYTAVQKERTADVRAIEKSGYWSMQSGRTQFLRDNPSIRKLVEKWGYSDSITTYLKAEDRAKARLNESKGLLSTDPRAWRSVYRDTMSDLAAQADVLFKSETREYPAGGVGKWLQFIDAHKNPVTQAVDWDAVDEDIRTKMTPAEKAELDAYEGRALTPEVREYKNAVKRIEESGYWDIGDSYARRLAARYGFDGATTMNQVRERLMQTMVERYMARGMGQYEAMLRADTYVDRRLSRYESRISQLRQRFRRRRTNRDISALLAQWGFWDPGVADTRRLVAS